MKRFVVLAGLISILAGPLCLQAAEKFLIDDFETKGNALYSKTGTYKKAPSDAKKGRTKKVAANGEYSLWVGFKKEVKGFCGYFLHLQTGGKYFDATKYSKITFMVKGKKGGENFQIGLADKYWFELDDSVKSDDITNYVPGGKITTEWQKAEIPLKVFVDKRSGDFDLSTLGSIAFCFETACFADGTGSGVIYLDDICLE